LEAAIIDNAQMDISSLSVNDTRIYFAKVAGPAALLVAKLHKLGERKQTPDRLIDKDAHDIYRLLVAVPTEVIATMIRRLVTDELAGPATRQALIYLRELFAIGPKGIGSAMAGQAEEGVGDPETVASSVAVLAGELLQAIG